MLKNTTYVEKFAMLQSWLPTMIDVVKKDLRNEHLKVDYKFFKRYFAGKVAAKLSVEELVPAYFHEVTEEHNEALGEFVCNRWLLKNTEIYDYFAQQLSQVTPEFQEIAELELPKALEVMEAAIQKFGPVDTYLFAVINSVVFPQPVFTELAKRADEARRHSHEERRRQVEEGTQEKSRLEQERLLQRTVDKYEKKLAGMQRKYHEDIASLKKQIAALQRQLQETKAGAA